MPSSSLVLTQDSVEPGCHRKSGSANVPGLGFQIGCCSFIPCSLCTGHHGRTGHLLALWPEALLSLFLFYSTSLPTYCIPHSLSSLQVRGTLREIKQFLLPKQSCGHSLVLPELSCVWVTWESHYNADADSVGLRWGPRVCIANQLPGAAGFASSSPLEQQGPTLDCVEQFLAYWRGRIWFSYTPIWCQTEKYRTPHGPRQLNR